MKKRTKIVKTTALIIALVIIAVSLILIYLYNFNYKNIGDGSYAPAHSGVIADAAKYVQEGLDKPEGTVMALQMFHQIRADFEEDSTNCGAECYEWDYKKCYFAQVYTDNTDNMMTLECDTDVSESLNYDLRCFCSN